MVRLMMIDYRTRYRTALGCVFLSTILQFSCALYPMALIIGMAGFILTAVFTMGAQNLFLFSFLPQKNLHSVLVKRSIPPRDAHVVSLSALALCLFIAVGELNDLVCSSYFYSQREIPISLLSILNVMCSISWLNIHGYPAVLLVKLYPTLKWYSLSGYETAFDRNAEKIIRNSPYPWLIDHLDKDKTG